MLFLSVTTSKVIGGGGLVQGFARSEERRVGKECVSTGKLGGQPGAQKKTNTTLTIPLKGEASTMHIPYPNTSNL